MVLTAKIINQLINAENIIRKCHANAKENNYFLYIIAACEVTYFTPFLYSQITATCVAYSQLHSTSSQHHFPANWPQAALISRPKRWRRVTVMPASSRIF